MMSCLNTSVSCTCNLFRHSNKIVNYNLTFVRFRKPRWVPKAPSKIFKVREPTPIDPVEAEKMMEWNNHYNTARKSVQSYLVRHSNEIERKKQGNIDEITLSFDQIYAQMTAKNNAWNAKTAKIREREMASISEVEAIRKQKLAERDIRELEEIRQEAKKKVLEAKDWKENFITEENLDDALEEMLNSRSDYEFALNHDGTTTGQTDTEEHNKT
ncbi:probable 28S ribosomal protein S26, mitochondrial [Mercenaria mercenaria]|uniref:probable 28S ribosomal protein S26, mitochondrial n=1 Tax=Mercenaria mercenaria TaxID=6596 RepID=UPI001E1DAE2D|nr:probable 28S ribosomal protein S26, mitochondrial [Mercenaria mercenaria]